MSQSSESPPVPARLFDWAADVAFESVLAFGFLAAMDALAHLKLTVAGIGFVVVGWVMASLLSGGVRRARGSENRLAPIIEFVGPALWFGVINDRLKQPWTIPEITYSVVFVFAAWRSWRWLISRAVRDGANRHAEALRLFVVGLAAAGVTLPFFTDLQLGGTDARWYTGVFSDFVTQLRAGVFPVFLGQGEWAFNGSVNLFRSAPFCLWLGGVSDWLTAQSLSLVAIRNLAVVMAAFGAGFSLYAVLIRLQRWVIADQSADGRWAAALLAVLYLECPSVLHALYYYELQMTFTALLAVPWIFYGNVRTLHGTDSRGYLPLAIGLAVIWTAHAPLAIICGLCTGALQLGRFIFEPAALAQWKAAVGGALLFGLLSAYYFFGMSELPSGFGPGLRNEAIFLAGITFAVFGVVHFFVRGHWTGVIAWLAGAGLVAITIPQWLVWVASWTFLFGALATGLRWAGRSLNRAGSEASTIVWAALAMLGAAAISAVWMRMQGWATEIEPMKALAQNIAARRELFLPLPARLTPNGSSHPGYALWLVAALVLPVALWVRNQALALLGVVILFLVLLIVGAPLVSDFIVGVSSPQLANLVNLPMFYRLVPPLAALIGMAGFLALALAGQRRPPWRRVALWALAAGVIWSSWEARKIVRYGAAHIASRTTTTESLSPSNYVLGRYSYGMLVSPTAFVDGKQFPWLESRLLNARGDLVVGPDQLARKAEEFDSDTLILTSRADATDASWLRVAPDWIVQPGETRLLRLEILPSVDCSGYLILQSEHGYQEFHLTANYAGTGFGVTPAASRVLAVTNPGIHAEHYNIRLNVEPGNTMPRDGGAWARLHVSRYDLDQAPVRVESLIPYRARVTTTQAGFLETPRQWLVGYRAEVGGRSVTVSQSPGGLVKIPVTPGTQTVELKFAGSTRLWIGFVISATTLLGLLVWSFLGRRAERAPDTSHLFDQWIAVNKK